MPHFFQTGQIFDPFHISLVVHIKVKGMRESRKKNKKVTDILSELPEIFSLITQKFLFIMHVWIKYQGRMENRRNET